MRFKVLLSGWAATLKREVTCCQSMTDSGLCVISQKVLWKFRGQQPPENLRYWTFSYLNLWGVLNLGHVKPRSKCIGATVLQVRLVSASDHWPGAYGELGSPGGSPGGAGREEKSAAVAMLGASVHLQHHSCG